MRTSAKTPLAMRMDSNRTPVHDALCIWFHDVGGLELLNRRWPEKCCADDLQSIVWEKPLTTSSGYLVGFVDLMFTFPECRVGVEIKPAIESLGETIRQIRLYQLHDPGAIFVVATPDRSFWRILEAQDIPLLAIDSVWELDERLWEMCPDTLRERCGSARARQIR